MPNNLKPMAPPRYRLPLLGYQGPALSVSLEALDAHNILISLYQGEQPADIDAQWLSLLPALLAQLQQRFAGLIGDYVSSYTSLLLVLDDQNDQDDAIALLAALPSPEQNDSACAAWQAAQAQQSEPDTAALVTEAMSESLLFRPIALDEALASDALSTADTELLTLPVCYDEAFGLDLAAVAEQCQLSPAEVIARHSEQSYRVYALGFSPGFAFMGRLDPALVLPRHSSPRAAVPAGSVAIAAQQTAIYPRQSPGGWHILGRCPLRLFDPARQPANCFRVGQRVRFQPISRAEFARLEAANYSAQQLAPIQPPATLETASIDVLKATGANLLVDQGRRGQLQQGLTAGQRRRTARFY